MLRELRGRLNGAVPHWADGESAQTSLAPAEPHWQARVLDEAGIKPGMLAEAVCGSSATGGSGIAAAGLLLDSIIQGTANLRGYQALVDGGDSFDPSSFSTLRTESTLARLLWVRCHTVAEVIKAADLLLRDGNVPLVMLDLLANPLREFQRQPANIWYRLRSLAENSQALCLVLTPCRSIAAAQIRLELSISGGLDLLECARPELAERLQARVTRQRLQVAPQPGSQIAAMAG